MGVGWGGWVGGPAVHGQAPFEVGVDQFVGVQFRRVRRQLDAVRVIGEPGADLGGAAGGVAIHDEVDLAVEVAYEPVEEAAPDVGVEGLGEDQTPTVSDQYREEVITITKRTGTQGHAATYVLSAQATLGSSWAG